MIESTISNFQGKGFDSLFSASSELSLKTKKVNVPSQTEKNLQANNRDLSQQNDRLSLENKNLNKENQTLERENVTLNQEVKELSESVKQYADEQFRADQTTRSEEKAQLADQINTDNNPGLVSQQPASNTSTSNNTATYSFINSQVETVGGVDLGNTVNSYV